jgi:hypothetical protein
MDIAEIYHFVFETYAGLGCLIGAGVVISVIAAFISEHKTRKIYKDRGEKPTTEGEDE